MATVANLQDVINENHLRSLELRFRQMQYKGIGVDFEEFQKMIVDVVGDFFPKKELKLIFVKVDSNSSGIIDWNGFISYILTELQMREQIMATSETALKSFFHVIKGTNQETMCRVSLMPYVSADCSQIDYSMGRYVTVSRDGLIAFWTQSWQLQKSRYCDVNNLKRCTWTLDMVCLPNMFVIAVASADETIKFYDSTSTKMELLSMLIQLDVVVTCMDYWFDSIQPSEGYLTFGDTKGNVTLLHFLNCIENKMFGVIGNKEVQKVVFKNVLHGMNKFVQVLTFSLHNEWVKQVRYIPRLKATLSCSTDSVMSMVLQGVTLKMTRRGFQVKRGMNCFDYSDALNVIATGSIDRCLRLWNPFVTGKSVASFYGHSTPIIHVLIISEVEQIVSVSADKSLRVWDLKDQACIQSVLTQTVNWGPYPITAAFHNKLKRQIILATTKIVVIERVWDGVGDDNTLYITHPKPLSGIVYSELYNQVITACRQGIITYWDLETGRKNIQIPNAHWIIQDGVQVSTEISALALDESKKKLFTAGRDSMMKMWNLSNGALLKSLEIPDNQEITVIISCKMHVFFAGWSRRVFICNDSLDMETLKAWPIRHSDDILDMSYLDPNLIVTSSWDGRIRIWLIESGVLKSTLTLPQHLSRQQLSVDISRSLSTRPSTLHTIASTETVSSINRSSMSSTMQKFPKVVKEPRVRLRGPKGGVPEDSPLITQLRECPPPAITCLHCLVVREIKPKVGNLLIADVTGMIQVWSTHPNGGILALFSSVCKADQYITCMISDSNNKYLITGDSSGHIRIWYISYFHCGKEKEAFDSTKPNPDTENFPFMCSNLQAVAAKARLLLSQFKPNEFGTYVTIDAPLLLSSYRGHLRSIVQMLIIDEKSLLLTASNDRSVRMWTLQGRYLVTFGDARGWHLTQLLTMNVKPADRKAPSDIRREGSAVTLQVLMAGLGPRWWKVRKLFLFIYVRAIMRRQKLKKQRRFIESEAIFTSPKTGPTQVSTTTVAETGTLSDSKEIQLKRELVFSQMGSPLGKNYQFKCCPPKQMALPHISEGKKEMNAVYAYMEQFPLHSINMDQVLPLLNPRLASKLKAIK